MAQTKFDWRHTAVLTEDDKARLAQGVARFDGVINREARIPYAGYGGKGTAYLHAPLNRYQKQAREGLGADDNVLYHYTQKFTAKIVNRWVVSPVQNSGMLNGLWVSGSYMSLCAQAQTTKVSSTLSSYSPHVLNLPADLPSEYRDKRKLEWNGKSKKAYERKSCSDLNYSVRRPLTAHISPQDITSVSIGTASSGPCSPR